ncbi:MAG: 30S ribosomal protein S17 [Stenotrophobium sp.]
MSEATDSKKAGNRVVGQVVSTKANKTITVLIERRERHPLYGKYVRKSTRLHAHDENNQCKEGDTVVIVETRPLSKLKRFRLVEVIKSAHA